METISVHPVERVTVRVKHRPPIAVRPKPRAIVDAKPINSLWERAGWTKQRGPRGDIYTGTYRVRNTRTGRGGTFDGRVEVAGMCQAYIRNPPAELRKHPKAPCFLPVASGWWHMNWWSGTADVDETIAYVEKVLDEAISGSGEAA